MYTHYLNYVIGGTVDVLYNPNDDTGFAIVKLLQILINVLINLLIGNIISITVIGMY